MSPRRACVFCGAIDRKISKNAAGQSSLSTRKSRVPVSLVITRTLRATRPILGDYPGDDGPPLGHPSGTGRVIRPERYHRFYEVRELPPKAQIWNRSTQRRRILTSDLLHQGAIHRKAAASTAERVHHGLCCRSRGLCLLGSRGRGWGDRPSRGGDEALPLAHLARHHPDPLASRRPSRR
jgi:hypothetical protein